VRLGKKQDWQTGAALQYLFPWKTDLRLSLMMAREWNAMGWFEQMRICWQESALAGLGWVARRRAGAEAMPAHLATGIEGENAAFFYLRRKGLYRGCAALVVGDLPGDVGPDRLARAYAVLRRSKEPDRSRCQSGRDRS